MTPSIIVALALLTASSGSGDAQRARSVAPPPSIGDRLQNYVDASSSQAALVEAHWRSTPPAGAPGRPTAFEIDGQTSYQRLTADQMAVVKSRMLAAIDQLLQQPALQDARIQTSVSRGWTYISRGELRFAVTVDVMMGRDYGSITLRTPNPVEEPGVNTVIGQTPGGCERQVHRESPGRSGEWLTVASPVARSPLAVRELEIYGASPEMLDRHYNFGPEPGSLNGRLVAASRTLNCARLLQVMNGG